MRGPAWILVVSTSLPVAGNAQHAAGDHTLAASTAHQIRMVPVASDVQLEVLDWGGDGPPLVFLAGLTLNAHSFDDFAPRFRDAYRVYAVTRRGHGASSWPDSGYTLERLVDDLRVVLDSLGVEQAILAGHSLGGDEITRFATEHGERVAGLVYIDAAYDGTLIEQVGLFNACPLGQEAADAIESRFENLEAFRRTQKRPGPNGTLVPYISSDAVGQLTSWSITPEYSRIAVPALAVYHTPRWLEDIVGGGEIGTECVSALQRITYESIAGFAKGMKFGRVVALEDTQHNVHLVTPDVLEEVMRRWLSAELSSSLK
jgi:pimeloyl-ACP methyl ester carboxylesterase